MTTSPQDSASPAIDPPRATRRRGEALLQAIYQTTLTELIDRGFEELSFDKIATKAGAGKASLYRRWVSPRDLLLDALTDPVSGFGNAMEPGTGAVHSDLLILLNHLADSLDRPYGRAMLALISQRSRNPELYVQVERLLIQPHEAVSLQVLQAGVERGEVDPDAANAQIAAVGSRLVVAEYTYSGCIDPAEVRAILDHIVMPAIAPREAATGRRSFA